MRKDLQRRLGRLERQLGLADFETKLRSFARKWGEDEEAYLRAVRGHERELGPELGEDGTITWGGFLLLRQMLISAHVLPDQAVNPRVDEPTLTSVSG